MFYQWKYSCDYCTSAIVLLFVFFPPKVSVINLIPCRERERQRDRETETENRERQRDSQSQRERGARGKGNIHSPIPMMDISNHLFIMLAPKTADRAFAKPADANQYVTVHSLNMEAMQTSCLSH